MPILNQREYRLAKARLAQASATIATEAMIDDLASGLSVEVSAARRAALAAEVERLRNDIEGYQKLQSVGGATTEPSSDELGLLPITARIARRLSQRELAERMGVSEQHVQRYESSRYKGISLTRYKRVLEILGVDLQSRLISPWPRSEPPDGLHPPQLELDAALVSELRKRNWIPLPKGMATEGVSQIAATYVAECAELSRTRTFFRRSIRGRAGQSESALSIWQARVLRQAALQRPKLKAKFNLVSTNWLTKMACLSARPDGPTRVANFLHERGIVFVIVPHLPHTHLDGASMLLSDGTPVIALTLRYDRLDSFWFTLFHELGHIFLHFHSGLDDGFIDSLEPDSESADDPSTENDRTPEREADLFALSAFVPDQVWESAPARFSRSSDLISKFAGTLGIGPAIVAGRIRKERGDYKIFNDLLGHRVVRNMLVEQFT